MNQSVLTSILFLTLIILISCYLEEIDFLNHLFLLLNRIIEIISSSVTIYLIIFVEIFNCCLFTLIFLISGYLEYLTYMTSLLCSWPTNLIFPVAAICMLYIVKQIIVEVLDLVTGQ